MSVLTVILIGFLGMRTAIATWNLLFPPTFRATDIASKKKLSILIPARNEEASLPTLLDQIKNCTHPDIEVIVLDDFSTDQTPTILRRYASTWEKLQYIPGKDLPPGWLGKNWACHQLGEASSGEYLLFLDADVAYLDPELPTQAIQEAQHRSLSLLSIFPTQTMPTTGEKMVVPLMHYLLLTLLPLTWIRALPFPSMAAANGQFMLFDGKQYRAHRWHQLVKGVIVEDIAIMQQIKQHKLLGMTFLGQKKIQCRMYSGFRSGVQGFGKNLLAGFGNSIPVLLLFIGLTQIAWLWAIFTLSSVLWGLSILLILWMRFCTHRASRESFWVHLGLHPIHMFMLLLIAGNSIYRRLSKKNIWKGRNVASP